MRYIERVITKQGHPVPKSAHHPKGPFPPELFAKPEVISDYVPLDVEIPVGGTAQNGFEEPKVFKCRFCQELVYEHKIPDHICEGEEYGEDA